jgi:hypothetical protein
MRILRYATYLWPGFPRVWFEGAWSGLALAAVFGLLVNFLALASFVWIEWVPVPAVWLGWVVAAAFWAVGTVFFGRRASLADSTAEAVKHDDLFRRGLGEYLKGAWFEAESLFSELVAKNPRDVDARLMLATLLRHTSRPADAERQLDELDRLERAQKWREEIERERLLLKAPQPDLIEPRARANSLPEGAAQAA